MLTSPHIEELVADKNLSLQDAGPLLFSLSHQSFYKLSKAQRLSHQECGHRLVDLPSEVKVLSPNCRCIRKRLTNKRAHCESLQQGLCPIVVIQRHIGPWHRQKSGGAGKPAEQLGRHIASLVGRCGAKIPGNFPGVPSPCSSWSIPPARYHIFSFRRHDVEKQVKGEVQAQEKQESSGMPQGSCRTYTLDSTQRQWRARCTESTSRASGLQTPWWRQSSPSSMHKKALLVAKWKEARVRKNCPTCSRRWSEPLAPQSCSRSTQRESCPATNVAVAAQWSKWLGPRSFNWKFTRQKASAAFCCHSTDSRNGLSGIRPGKGPLSIKERQRTMDRTCLTEINAWVNWSSLKCSRILESGVVPALPHSTKASKARRLDEEAITTRAGERRGVDSREWQWIAAGYKV